MNDLINLFDVVYLGLNVKIVKKGGVQMKCWDIGGQAAYRSEWPRYTRLVRSYKYIHTHICTYLSIVKIISTLIHYYFYFTRGCNVVIFVVDAANVSL